MCLEDFTGRIPRLGETESIQPRDKLIFLHFFIGEWDWYIAEYNGGDSFFEYAIINNDLENAEWGYISFEELKQLRVPPGIEVNYEVFDEPKRAREIDRVAQGSPVIEQTTL